MTSTNVTQAAAGFLDTVSVSSVSVSRTADDGFSQIMSRTSQSVGGRTRETTKTAADAGTQRGDVAETKRSQESQEPKSQEPDRAQNETTREPDTQETGNVAQKDEAPGSDDAEQAAAAEAVGEAAAEIKEAIAETLDMSEEDVEELIEQLGLTDAQLLTPEAMQQIVVAAAGESDQTSILTNEAMYGEVRQLTETVETVTSDLQDQLGMDDGRFAETLRQLEENPAAEQAPAGQTPEPETEALQDGAPEAGTEAEKMPAVVVSEENPAAEEKETDGESDTQETVPVESAAQTDRTQTSSTDGQAAGSEAEKQGDRESGQTKENRTETGGHFMQDVQKSAVEAWTDNVAETTASHETETADAQRIMEQILDYMKVEIKPETTELEMRLHPETLGNVNIRLTAKEGVVTAQFTTENESVRAVLEAQAAQLRENLNQQGVKVEAVEVTIASHAFDRSFAESGGESGAYDEPKKKGVRRIRLSDEISLDDMELTDEERIAAEMMQQNGNTVDYTA